MLNAAIMQIIDLKLNMMVTEMMKILVMFQIDLLLGCEKFHDCWYDM